LLGRDASWSLPLFNLPGRAGLDLSLVLSYSSMVWTRSGSSIYFDDDNGSPSPGFRLGFATVQGPFFDSQVGVNAYLLVTSSGRRVELRQVGSSNIYESGDSTHLQLTDNSAGSPSELILRGTDGTRVSYASYPNEWCATKIRDRNGNYIAINNNAYGDIQTITDTLGRAVQFNYDTNANISSITQMWNGSWHTLANFSWGAPLTMDVTGFTGVSVVGTYTGEQLPVLRAVGLPDGSYYAFDYRIIGQVSMIRSYRSDNVQRNYTAYDYDTWSGDCPRITQTRVWAENWSGIYGVPNEVIMSLAVNGDGSHQMTAPDGTIYKEVYGTGWQRGLVTRSESWSGGVLQKWTITAYDQDNTSVSYQTNPRVTGTDIHDADGNLRRTIIDYDSYAAYGLPHVMHEYAAGGLTEIRRTYLDYNLGQPYLDRRIIGLVSARQVFNPVSGLWESKTTYDYDSTGVQTQATTATSHDQSYDSANTARGNLTAVARWDMTQPNNSSAALTTHTTYDAAGSVVIMADAAGHQTSIGYTDNFSDGLSHNTFAYPTTLTDADNYSASVHYNYDFGAKTEVQGPPPAGQSTGLHQIFVYDNIGRLYELYTANNGAATFYNYGAYYLNVWSSVNQAGESYSGELYDGLGRVFGRMSHHPGSVGGYSAQLTIYDAMGRPSRQSNPTEVNGSWVPTGDDAAGWIYSYQTYDWKGRPLVTTNQDGTQRYASYAGCGCAGGEVVTLTDEVGRRQKVYSDVLGRQLKSEVLNWNGSVYSAVVNTLNALDQITNVRQWTGAENGGGTYQDTTMSYDGYGRLASKHVPEQQDSNGNPTYTTWAYKSDDAIERVTDGRGASATYIYNNNRHLVNETHYSAPAGIAPTSNVTFGYDAVGNRTSMSDGMGTKSYSYNSLSQLMSETRTFADPSPPYLNASFTLNYDYNLAGELKKITDSTNVTINYGFDAIGRVNSVTGSDNLYVGVSNYASTFQYRAWGGLKSMTDGSGHTSSLSYNSKLHPSQFDISGNVVHQNYDYYNDGRISFVHNTTDANFDRSYGYDHAARLTSALSGAAAWGTSGTTPYSETFGYDAFSNLNWRQSDQWNGSFSDSDSSAHSNNRRIGWGYDSDGRNTTIDTRSYAFDTLGKTKSMTAQQLLFNGNHATVSQSFEYDADGEQLKNGTSQSGITTTTYYVCSTVLGGAVIEELNSSGQKTVGYVYSAGGGRLAIQSGAVIWKQHTPAGTSEYTTNSSNSAIGRTEFDPLGADVSLEAPPSPPPNEGDGDISAGHIGGILDSRWSDFFNLSSGCSKEGVLASCSGSMNVTNLDAEMRAAFGYRWYDLPGNFDARAQGEERYLGLISSGFDLDFGRYWGTYSLIVNGINVESIKNPTLNEKAGLEQDAANYEQYGTAYLPDSSQVDLEANTVTIYGGAEYFVPQNSGQSPTIDLTKPECLPQQVKDTFKDAWKASGYSNRDNSEYSFSIDRDPNTKALAATTPKSTHEFSAGQVQVTKINGITVTVAGVHTHGPGDLYGLSETDKDSAIKAGIAMYVMAPDGGLYLYDPAVKATQKSRRDIHMPDIDYAYGVRVGDLRGKNNFWDKPCK